MNMPDRIVLRFVSQKFFAGVFALACLQLMIPSGFGQESENQGGFGLSRIFRFGASSRESASGKASGHQHNHDDHDTEVIARNAPNRAGTGSVRAFDEAGVPFQPAVSSPGFGQSSTARISARPNQTGPVTEADPILTRVGIGRADSGSTFGLFLQIYADGTVIDSEGVHHLPISQIRQVLNVIRGHDFSRIKGHCGQPSADFVENVQMIVYDRSLGRLRAHAFSYSGNPEGCDDSVVHLHKSVEDLVLLIAGGKPESTIGQVGPESGTNQGVQMIGSSSPSLNVSTPANSVGLTQVVEPSSPVTSLNTIPTQATQNQNYSQGAVVPRLPSTATIPQFQNPGLTGQPSLAPPR